MDERAGKVEALGKTIQATRKFPSGEWQQHLRVSLVGETVYIDEGNGSFSQSSPTASSSSSSSSPQKEEREQRKR
jgi:hypothetical protein